MISKDTMLTLRKIISDGQFESNSRALLRKPDFFFNDSIEEDEVALYDGNYKWLCQIGDRKFFLPNMERIYPLSYLQHMSVHRIMDWDLVKPYSGVSLGKLGIYEAYSIGHGRGVLGLQPGLVWTEYPTGETPSLEPLSSNNSLRWEVTSLLNFMPPAGFILLVRTGGMEWWDLFWQNLETFCYRLGYKGLLELFNTASRRAPNIFTLS